MLGARLRLPVHFPLGVLGLGLQQVHSLFCFDPAGKHTKKKNKSVLLEEVIYDGGQR